MAKNNSGLDFDVTYIQLQVTKIFITVTKLKQEEIYDPFFEKSHTTFVTKLKV